MMKHIIFDCDNTMGMEGRPMDDALALLYLLGSPEEARVLGVCCNCGNGTSAEVYDCCRRLLEETGFTHLPLFRGAEAGEDPRCDSARFIVQAVNEHPGEVSYLGIGSLTNLYGAYLLDSGIFDKLADIVLMGGITQPLHIHGKALAELNFSVNSIASACVLEKGKNITVITGNNCLPVAYLPKDEFMPNMCYTDNPAGMYIAQKCGYRFEDKKVLYGADGSYCWDAVAAAYLIKPELFEDHFTPCHIRRESLESGFLAPGVQGNCVLNLPCAKDKAEFQNELYRGWLALKLDNSFACKGSFLDKLLQPAILIELSKSPRHGFQLQQDLKANGLIDGDNLDPAGMYRTLKRMEKAGYLSSGWDRSQAKARRVFAITEFGQYSLNNWNISLRRYRDHIDELLDAMAELETKK